MRENERGKIIKDPVHGFMDLNEMQKDLLSQPEIQRLAWIRQLGLVFTVYPGASHTRLEHCLGTSFLCGEIADQLDLDEEDKKLLEAAGLLHDLGHAPFSHAIEPIMPESHTEITRNLILGESNLPEASGVTSTLGKHGISPRGVADLVTGQFNGDEYLQDIISSQMDADQLDYLTRDGHHTGVSYGTIEVEWLINVMRVNRGSLTYLEKGLDAIEQYLVARDQMYSSVYRHKTADIVQEMLLRATKRYAEKEDISDLLWLTDGELFEKLRTSDPYSKEMVERIKTRRLYKDAYSVKSTDSEGKKKKVKELVSRETEDLEREIASMADIDSKEVMVNEQEGAVVSVEPRLREFDIKITKGDGEIVPLDSISEIVKSLKKKEPMRNLFSVYTTPEHRKKVRKAVKKLL